MSPPAPRVWLKRSAAIEDGWGRLWWLRMRCPCVVAGVEMPDGRRIPLGDLNPRHAQGGAKFGFGSIKGGFADA